MKGISDNFCCWFHQYEKVLITLLLFLALFLWGLLILLVAPCIDILGNIDPWFVRCIDMFGPKDSLVVPCNGTLWNNDTLFVLALI